MSQLWACYIADNVERFRRLLALTGHSAQAAAVWNANVGVAAGGGFGSSGSGPGDTGGGSFATSPRASAGKPRKVSGYGLGGGPSKSGASGGIGKNEINSRDHAGLTILLRAASSTAENALAFVQALLEHPAIDIYVQDPESGWNALHRALYAGNIAIARLLLQKERKDIAGQTLGAPVGRIGQLIKTKDHEGNSPFDLYNSTIGERLLDALEDAPSLAEDGSDDDEIIVQQNRPANTHGFQLLVNGEDLFLFGSSKNLTLGMGDGDDRQFPERVYLKRPDHLLFRFYNEYLEKADQPDDASPPPSRVTDLPAWIRGQPLLISDVVLSKLHSAVLTADPVSNLYMCGIGRGGRLGLGDENTRFSFEPVQGPLADKKIVKVALGQNHSMAVTDDGQLWTWGSNTFSQLGYALPPSPKRDEDPMTPVPRQVFGPLRKEYILGVAASALHSVAHTGSSLYCWGKNVGQLALMDADSRSLDIQPIPRKVAASLFSAPIVAVSAIDKATTCLLANHTVCVFTSYGYNIVKFNFAETFGHHARIGSFNMSSRYDAGRSQINNIASGGETIVAVTGRGDLFTMNLTNLAEAKQSAASTTNPSKIRDSLTAPQCIWNARKDGVRSVGVGEQGSVIISTHSGAVWRRVKRAKAKDAHVSSGVRVDAKKKDYKFQRVPYITNVATVRSSAFGAFAAIRCDSAVIKERTGIDAPTLWDDVAPLMVLDGFESSEPASKDADTLKFWNAQAVRQQLGPVAYQILRAVDLENDLAQHLEDWTYRNRGSASLGAVLCTSLSPDIRIPVHTWMVSARSSILRDALAECRRGDGSFELPEAFTVKTEDAGGGDETVVTFLGLDLLSLLNFVLYVYEDKVVPVWNYTRQTPVLAYRYRQVRTEVMKLATRLNMPNLEAAVRIQTEPKKTMHTDFRRAIKDSRFFEDADAILELNGAEVPVHSVFLCQRCPWFKGLFHGRSRGQWLAGRRETHGASSDKIRLDMKHMDPKAFQYILQFLYADPGLELFDHLTAPDLEGFFDAVIDVLGIANELMLDRVSQICQAVIGQYATTRNISHLLNTISVCSVSEFKDAGLEYICLQMETMLENHLLDDLDEDLLLDLDVVVRDNQTAQMPFARSGRAELELHQKYPELAQDIDEERQRRVREMAFKAVHRDDERRTVSSSFKTRIGSVDDQSATGPSPSADRSRRKSRVGRNEAASPVLRPKASQADLMFSMEDDDATGLTDSPLAGTRPGSRGEAPATQDALEDDAAGGSMQEERGLGPQANMAGSSPAAISAPPTTPARMPGGRPAGRGFVRLGPVASPAAVASPGQSTTPKAENGSSPWRAPAVSSTSKLDLRAIMTESSSSPPTSRMSALSAGLDAQRAADAATAMPKIIAPKMSQKERKKQQQQQQLTQAVSKSVPKGPAWETGQSQGEGKRPGVSWQGSPSPQTPSAQAKQPMHLLAPPPSSPMAAAGGPSNAIPVPAAADSQPGSAAKPTPKKPSHFPRAASPDTRFAGQPRPSAAGSAPRAGSISTGISASPSASAPRSPSSSSAVAPLMPHSRVYIKPAPKAEPILGLTMADIFLQQQLEQESIKEAVAKRSLQEIQQEQAFQEWWDQESRRTQDEEARRQARGDKGREGREGRGRGGRGGGTAADGKASRRPSAGASAAAPGGPGGSGEARGAAAARKNKPAGNNKAAASRGGAGERGGGSRGHRGGRGGVGGGGDLGGSHPMHDSHADRGHDAEAAAGGGDGGALSSRRRGGGRGGKA